MPRKLDPRVNLQFYTREGLRNADVWTDKLIRSEYSRLRDIAVKRLERLGRVEPESFAYRANVGQYAPARGQTTEQLRTQLPLLAKFIAARTGSVMGIQAQRRKAVESLQERGFAFINAGNIRQFGEFMDSYRSKRGAARTYSSFQAAEVYEFTQEHDIDPERVKRQFAQWLAHEKELQRYVRKRNKAGEEVSADDIIKEFNRLERERRKEKRSLKER